MMWGTWGMSGAVWLVSLLLVLMVAVAGAAAGALVMARRGFPAAGDDGRDPGRARQILDERLAAGEIDLVEHERLRVALVDWEGSDR
jgi:putative membrane protein